MPLLKWGNKKKFSNCGNGIAENGGKKKGSEIYERVKKKKGDMFTIFLKHFHNKSHVISYYQLKKICDKLIVAMPLPKQGGKKNLWQSNCGNGIAEIGRKKKL